MADESSKPSAKQKAPAKSDTEKEREKRDPNKPSDADAPGPITPEHESGSWEQTLEEQDRK